MTLMATISSSNIVFLKQISIQAVLYARPFHGCLEDYSKSVIVHFACEWLRRAEVQYGQQAWKRKMQERIRKGNLDHLIFPEAFLQTIMPKTVKLTFQFGWFNISKTVKFSDEWQFNVLNMALINRQNSRNPPILPDFFMCERNTQH